MDHYADQEWRRPGQLIAGVVLCWGSLALLVLWALLGLRSPSPFTLDPTGPWFNMILLVLCLIVMAWVTFSVLNASPAGRIVAWVLAALVTVWPGVLVSERLAVGGFDGRTYLLVVAVAAVLTAARLLTAPEVSEFIAESALVEAG